MKTPVFFMIVTYARPIRTFFTKNNERTMVLPFTHRKDFAIKRKIMCSK